MSEELSQGNITENNETSTGSGRMSSEDRRRQLIEVGIRLFSQKGFRGTTTKEITDAANVNPAILFRNFPTKDDLYAAILDFKVNEINLDGRIDELRKRAESRDDEGLFRMLAARILEYNRRDHEFLRLMLYSALEGHELARSFIENQSHPTHEFLRDYIITRQREGAFRKCDSDAAVRVFMGAFNHHSLLKVLFGPEFVKITDDEAINDFTEVFLNGLRVATTENRS